LKNSATAAIFLAIDLASLISDSKNSQLSPGFGKTSGFSFFSSGFTGFPEFVDFLLFTDFKIQLFYISNHSVVILQLYFPYQEAQTTFLQNKSYKRT
jgi:hypothetical protein